MAGSSGPGGVPGRQIGRGDRRQGEFHSGPNKQWEVCKMRSLIKASVLVFALILVTQGQGVAQSQSATATNDYFFRDPPARCAG